MNQISISSETGLTVELLDYGARIHDVKVPVITNREKTKQSVVCGYATPEEYLQDPFYMGASVGPIANRIRHGQLCLGAHTIQLPTNQQGHCLHSGELGFDAKYWALAEQTSNAAKFVLDIQTYAQIPLHVSASYTVDANTLQIEYEVKTRSDVYINMTNHTYWNLNSQHESIQNHSFDLAALAIANKDNDDIPTGQLQLLDHPYSYKFTNAADQAGLADTVDHHFVVDEYDAGLKRMVVARSPQSPLSLTVSSTKPGFQLYSAHFLSGQQKPFAGFCVEPQYAPDAPNLAGFAAPLTTPEVPYHHRIEYQFDAG